MQKKVDILIIGGGLVGLALLHALKPLGVNVLLADAKSLDKTYPKMASLDTRSIALSPASIRILKHIGCWERLQSQLTPIELIHVSEQGRFGQAKLQSESQTEPLGVVIPIDALYEALRSNLPESYLMPHSKLTALNPETGVACLMDDNGPMQIEASWVIAADGTQSQARLLCELKVETKLYGEHALVTALSMARHHQYIAYERFTPSGPLALLPRQGNSVGMVWTLPPEQAQSLQMLPEQEFIQTIQKAFGYRAGRMLHRGQVATYPLKQVIMPQKVMHKVVFIGNAAQTIHPVAAQGFNLGLRDVAVLAGLAAKKDFTSEQLSQYQVLRAKDQAMITQATDALVKLFKLQIKGFSHVRALGLLAFDNQPWIKKNFLHYAKGYGGFVPDLICEAP